MAANPLKVATRGTTTQLRTYSGPFGSIAVDTLTGALVAGNGTAGGVRMALEKDAIVGISLSGTTLTITRGNGTAYGITLPTSGSGGGGSSVAAHAILSTGTAIGTVTVDGVVTTFYAPSASGGTGGSTVSVSPTLYSGTQIATITVDGSPINLYAPAASGGTSGSTVSVNPILTTGTQIATITVDGTPRAIYAPAASAGGSTVSVNPMLGSGTQIATITVDGSPFALYAPAASSSGSTVSVNPMLGSGTQIATITIDGSPFALYAPAASEATSVSYISSVSSGTALGTLNVGSNSYTIYAPASSNVSYVSKLSSGTQIGTLTVGSSTYTLYAPSAGTYSGTSPISVSGTTISHANSGVTAGSYGPSSVVTSGSFNVPQITVNASGHITGVTNRSVTLPSVSTSDFVTISGNQTITGVKTFSASTNAFAARIYVYGTTANSGIGLFHMSSVPSGNDYTNKVAGFQGHYASNVNAAAVYAYVPDSTASTNADESYLAVRSENATSSIGARVTVRIGSRKFTTSSSTNVFMPEGTNWILGGTAAANRWQNAYAVVAQFDTSDARVKSNVADVPDALLDAWENVHWRQYQLNDALGIKGADARIHTGGIAQEIKAVCEAGGLDAFRYGFIGYDEWEAEEPEYAENGNILKAGLEAGNLYSLRYAECLCVEAAYQRRRAARLEARVEELETKLASVLERLGGNN